MTSSIVTFQGNTPLTMSSREIADLCEARHNDVVATIERLFEKGVLRESRKTLREYEPQGGGRPTQVYDLTKRDTLVVISGYDAELRAKIIDRWMGLEEQLHDQMLAAHKAKILTLQTTMQALKGPVRIYETYELDLIDYLEDMAKIGADQIAIGVLDAEICAAALRRNAIERVLESKRPSSRRLNRSGYPSLRAAYGNQNHCSNL